MENATTYNDLKREFGITNDGDSWGTVMGWLFAISDVLHFDRDDETPIMEWGYSPSPIQSEPKDTFEAEIAREADTADLIEFGCVLSRYANMLEKAGKNY